MKREREAGREWESEKEKEKKRMEKKGRDGKKKNWATSDKMNQNNTLKAQVA